MFRGGGGPPRERLRASPSTGPRSWRVTARHLRLRGGAVHAVFQANRVRRGHGGRGQRGTDGPHRERSRGALGGGGNDKGGGNDQGHNGNGQGNGHGNGDTLLRSTLAPSVPGDPTFHGVGPGSVQWVLQRGEVRLKRNGEFRLRLRGLVIPSPPGDNTPGPVTHGQRLAVLRRRHGPTAEHPRGDDRPGADLASGRRGHQHHDHRSVHVPDAGDPGPPERQPGRLHLPGGMALARFGRQPARVDVRARAGSGAPSLTRRRRSARGRRRPHARPGRRRTALARPARSRSPRARPGTPSQPRAPAARAGSTRPDAPL